MAVASTSLDDSSWMINFFIEKAKEIDEIAQHKLSIYKNPLTIYQTYCNSFAVAKKVSRLGKPDEVCQIEESFKTWKKSNIEADFMNIFEIALKRARRREQPKISGFFVTKPKAEEKQESVEEIPNNNNDDESKDENLNENQNEVRSFMNMLGIICPSKASCEIESDKILVEISNPARNQ